MFGLFDCWSIYWCSWYYIWPKDRFLNLPSWVIGEICVSKFYLSVGCGVNSILLVSIVRRKVWYFEVQILGLLSWGKNFENLSYFYGGVCLLNIWCTFVWQGFFFLPYSGAFPCDAEVSTNVSLSLSSIELWWFFLN